MPEEQQKPNIKVIAKNTDVKVEEKGEPIFTDRYVKPHRKVSRDVTPDDVKRVAEEAHVMYNLCFCAWGMYRSGFAVAHPQIDDKDPLRFFVTAKKEIIINPVITNHTKVPVKSLEGCLTMPLIPQVSVSRFNKCVVGFNTLTKDGSLSERLHKELSGQESRVWQHEIDHFDAIYIFDAYVDDKKENT